MKTNFRNFCALAAIAALAAQPAAAQAAKPQCLTAGEVRALTTFAMPSVLTGLIANCGPQVGARSYMMTRGNDLVTAYSARKGAAWPAARKAFFRLTESGKATDKEMAQALAKMPDAALQPFVEAMLSGMIGAKLKPGQCVIADKLMRLLAPLPPENTTELLSTIIELADADDKPGPAGFDVCK